MWNDVKLRVVDLPIIYTLLDTPSGCSLVASTLGVDNNEESVLEKLTKEPESKELLRKLENDLLVIKAVPKHAGHWMPSVLTIILALMVSGMFLALFLIPPSEAYAQVLIMIAGTILGAFSTAVAFWLGSSQGSWEKQKTITNK